MKLAIMQPYFMPYIGYFQLMNAVDQFVVYDNIQFTKKGWFNRNRILVNGVDKIISLPLMKDSDYLDVCNRQLAASFDIDRRKLFAQIEGAYRKAPFFPEVMPLIKDCFGSSDLNLFRFIYESLIQLRNHLKIGAEIIISSEVKIDHTLRGQDKVIAICKALGADQYINAIGGSDLYSKDLFQKRGVRLNFIKSREIVYSQFQNEFVPWLSIIDVMMFNPTAIIQEFLNQYDIV